MTTFTLYKIGALVVGAAVCAIIDNALGIKYPYPLWKRLSHKIIYMVWGGAIAIL